MRVHRVASLFSRVLIGVHQGARYDHHIWYITLMNTPLDSISESQRTRMEKRSDSKN
jgi:hypothetical protein